MYHKHSHKTSVFNYKPPKLCANDRYSVNKAGFAWSTGGICRLIKKQLRFMFSNDFAKHKSKSSATSPTKRIFRFTRFQQKLLKLFSDLWG